MPPARQGRPHRYALTARNHTDDAELADAVTAAIRREARRSGRPAAITSDDEIARERDRQAIRVLAAARAARRASRDAVVAALPAPVTAAFAAAPAEGWISACVRKAIEIGIAPPKEPELLYIAAQAVEVEAECDSDALKVAYPLVPLYRRLVVQRRAQGAIGGAGPELVRSTAQLSITVGLMKNALKRRRTASARGLAGLYLDEDDDDDDAAGAGAAGAAEADNNAGPPSLSYEELTSWRRLPVGPVVARKAETASRPTPQRLWQLPDSVRSHLFPAENAAAAAADEETPPQDARSEASSAAGPAAIRKSKTEVLKHKARKQKRAEGLAALRREAAAESHSRDRRQFNEMYG